MCDKFTIKPNREDKIMWITSDNVDKQEFKDLHRILQIMTNIPNQLNGVTKFQV